MPSCKHGELIPKTGFSQKTRRMWAAWMCKDKSPGCPPEWVSESEVFGFWYQALKTGGADKVLYDGDEPPF